VREERVSKRRKKEIPLRIPRSIGEAKQMLEEGFPAVPGAMLRVLRHPEA
jgi:hypothetical protein